MEWKRIPGPSLLLPPGPPSRYDSEESTGLGSVVLHILSDIGISSAATLEDLKAVSSGTCAALQLRKYIHTVHAP